MGKLEDMRVERVDGVDKPATGHRWAIIKSEGAPSSVEKDYEGSARAALEALLKEEGVTFTKETADALHALAALLEMSVEFKSEAGAAPEPAADDDEPVTKGALKSLLKESLEELIASEIDEADDDETVEKVKPASKQPDEQDEVEKTKSTVRKDGRPSFSNIFFGDN